MPLIQTRGSSSISGYGGASVSSVSSTPTYIEDVFSTYLYTGNGSTQTITNGIDLSGKGGLVWTKSRTETNNPDGFQWIRDTSRGITNRIAVNSTDGQIIGSDISSTTSSGFNLGYTNADCNRLGNSVVSWTFRKQPKFFDVVTYTGNGSNQFINHNLQSVPGCVIIKRTDSAGDWYVSHNYDMTGSMLLLNSTAAAFAAGISVTSTTFRVFGSTGTALNNVSGATYVAYLFAHNAGGFGLTGSDNVISCGSFTTDGSGNATVNLGYEPQYVMYKSASTAGGAWQIFDSMRGLTMGADNTLSANSSAAEGTVTDWLTPSATGFSTVGASFYTSATYIYIAIRRGPMKTPTSGTSVFAPVVQASASPTLITTNFPVDMSWMRASLASANQIYDLDRLRGNSAYSELAANAEQTYSGGWNFQSNVGVNDVAWSSSGAIWWNFRRAPGFFDVVCYTGTGSARTVAHNLGVAPQLIILKNRGAATGWFAPYSGSSYLVLNTTAAGANGSGAFDMTQSTASVFWLGSDGGQGYNGSSNTYVAYLFATCAGVSKVGSYTGTGALQTINCGFTGGARFVLIKRTDSSGDWYVWDTARGIIAGNDPYLLLNSTAAEVTNTDYIDPVASGFELSSTAPAAINANGGTYIYLAIA